MCANVCKSMHSIPRRKKKEGGGEEEREKKGGREGAKGVCKANFS